MSNNQARSLPWQKYTIKKRVMNKELFEAIKKVLPDVPLNPREHKILEYRFGVIDNNTHTLEETGKLFGVTRERIRQIEFKALEKLKEGGWIDKSLWG